MQLQEEFMYTESAFKAQSPKQACPVLCGIKEALYIPCMHVPKMIHYQCENESPNKYN